MKQLFYTTIESVIGRILLVCGEEKELFMLKIMNNRGEKDLLSLLLKGKSKKEGFEFFENVGKRSGYFEGIMMQLNDYFEGKRRTFEVRLNEELGSDFDHKVWNHLKKEVKYGETKYYQEIGEKLGYSGSSSQAIGGANGRNYIHIIIPCHRVIRKSGELNGYDGGLKAKEWLLDHERRNSRLN